MHVFNELIVEAEEDHEDCTAELCTILSSYKHETCPILNLVSPASTFGRSISRSHRN